MHGRGRRWMGSLSREPESPSNVQAALIYEDAFDGMDRDFGSDLAELSHKTTPRLSGDAWFYGELDLKGAWDLLKMVSPSGVFVDLGSGLGKIVIAAALLDVFDECRGVEILPELHAEATVATRRAQTDPRAHLSPISLSCGDMLATDISDADVVYVFATCFPPDLMTALETKLQSEMKRGARLCLVSKQLSEGAAAAFVPWDVPYVSVPQAHTKWNLDCYLLRRV